MLTVLAICGINNKEATEKCDFAIGKRPYYTAKTTGMKRYLTCFPLKEGKAAMMRKSGRKKSHFILVTAAIFAPVIMAMMLCGCSPATAGKAVLKVTIDSYATVSGRFEFTLYEDMSLRRNGKDYALGKVVAVDDVISLSQEQYDEILAAAVKFKNSYEKSGYETSPVIDVTVEYGGEKYEDTYYNQQVLDLTETVISVSGMYVDFSNGCF